MKQHYTIPIFIPEKACPHRCVYCNQYNIAGKKHAPNPEEVKKTIEQYLATFPKEGTKKIGFFGGSFTGMPIEEQNRYLNVTLPYIENGHIEYIQLSTRPDYISEEILHNFKQYRVKIIELGAQSLDPDVLRHVHRGHSVKDVGHASALIIAHGFDLGLQMMIGLPGSSLEKEMDTAREIIRLGARYTRIYPTLVINDTDLAKMYAKGTYSPLTLEEAVARSKTLLTLFEAHHVTVLRIGLHPSEGLMSGESLVAGPFHVSFKELVLTEIWKDILSEAADGLEGKKLIVSIPHEQRNAAIGYEGKNKKCLLQKFSSVAFTEDDALVERQIKIAVL